MEIITSTSNNFVKMLRGLKEKKGRGREDAFLVEGAKFVGEIGAEWSVRHVVMSASFASEYGRDTAVVLSDGVFATISDVLAPQGIMAVVQRRNFGINELFVADKPLVFMLEEINDPGNLGTILRTCHGLGAAGIILSPNCVDIYSPKVARASAGSIFHIAHVVMDLQQAAAELKGRGVPIYATLPLAKKPLHQLDLRQAAAFLLGNEHKGLKDETAALACEAISIPAAAESLNVSICAAILAYEASRQRLI